VKYIPQSTLVAGASTDGTIRLFDPTKSDQSFRTLGEVGDPPVNGLDISPDGADLATASEDRNIRVWRILDGTLKRPSMVRQQIPISRSAPMEGVWRSQPRTPRSTYGSDKKITNLPRSSVNRVESPHWRLTYWMRSWHHKYGLRLAFASDRG
jgi:WD40 repeat protein